ncbi:NACHT domain-containing protein [Streptomyces sp. NPDC006516]|uniref:NACHT domain-containing protein n=1 Tax=Streptomyces sp. NPDC006516 TaxID=3154309 RepID=UPI0033B2F6E8
MSLLQPADRTVVVSGALQGSGVLLTDRLVLTCAHVVKSGSRCYLAHPALGSRIAASVAWIDHDLDAALLQTEVQVIEAGPVRLGLVDTRQAIHGCEITGFPRIQRYGAEKRVEADQYTATVLPMAGRLRRLLVCDLDQPPAVRPDEEPSVLAGLSGGPVFAGDVLLGIARQVPRQRGGRRVECVPLGPVLSAGPFRLVYEQTGPRLQYESVRGHFPEDLRYEEAYAASIGAAYRRTKIFGLDELGRHDSQWDLDTAYLSLEAQSQPRSLAVPPTGPQRVDALLADRPRVLLRGDAGAGKTTLLWWLAAHTSARTLSDALEPLNGLIPFVVPLRTLRARGSSFPGPAELSEAAGLVIDRAPDGWAGRVLESGRALLLVDGLDEVPPEEREQAHAWLSQLLLRYPDTRCVATVRPLAVEPGWLDSEGFEELRLLPMRNEDIQSFVRSWHRAARLSEDDEDLERLTELERDLSRQFAQNSILRDLGRTPLLCAVICALHRRREGFLPETRWKLYRSALEMLLGHRDRRRRIERPEGIVMDVEEHTQLLQRIAVWLVREGQSEFTREQALRQLDRALPGMGRVSAQGTADQILTHLLNRSGLLQEHTDETYQFAHRTFQDFLAAKELIEDDHLGELLGHAGEEQWQDVILLSAGHCGRRELPLLVEGLLDAGLAYREGTSRRTGLYVLAALCEQHAAWLEGEVRERLRRSMEALFPPSGEGHVQELTRLGDAALAFLPAPGSVPTDSPPAVRMVQLLSRIGGRAAIGHVREWAAAHPSVISDVATNWAAFPPDEFATEVLAHWDLARDYVVAQRPQLSALRRLPTLRKLALIGDLPEDELRAALEDLQLTALHLHANTRAVDLAALGSQSSTLRHLRLQACPAVESLAPLVDLAVLDTLQVHASGCPADFLSPVPGLARLTRLDVTGLASGELSALPVHPGVVRLRVGSDRAVVLDGLSAWESLSGLRIGQVSRLDHLLTALGANPRITFLELDSLPWEYPAFTVPPVTSLKCLTVRAPRDGAHLPAVCRLFPGLSDLVLTTASSTGELDLTSLHPWPGLRVTVVGDRVPALRGRDGLGDRLSVVAY